MDYPKVHDWFQDVCSRFPSHTAIKEPGRSVNYENLKNHVDEIECTIASFHPQHKEIIAVFIEAGIDYVAVILATLRAGHIFMPVNMNFPDNRIINILNNSQPGFLVMAGKDKDRLSQILDRLTARVLQEEKPIANRVPNDDLYISQLKSTIEEDQDNANRQMDPKRLSDDACYVMSTSGSTGEPKIILGSHKGLSHFIHWEIEHFGIKPEVKGSFLSHVTFDVSLRDIFVPLLSGGTLCIPGQTERNTPEKLIGWIEAEKISLIHIVPTLLRTIFSVLPEHESKNERFQLLETALIAGEPLYGNDVSNWRTRINHTTRIVNIYGPSETTLAKVFYEIKSEEVLGSDMLPIGRPIPDTQVLILNGKKRICEIDEKGEIYIKTPYRSLGYLGNQEQEDLNFVPDPTENDPIDLIYRTGDLGKYVDQHLVMCIGRSDNQVKLHGNRVEINEIEAVLRTHPNVAQVAIGVKKDPFGNDRLIGYIVPSTDELLPAEDLRKLVSEFLPDYMIPSLFVYMEQIPLTHNNKIDRKALPEPTKKRPLLQQEYIPPRNETEKKLVDIWEKVLDLEMVGVDDNFFDIGGTSILSMHIISFIKSQMGLEIPVTKVFQYPTVRKFSQYIGNEAKDFDNDMQLQDRALQRRAALIRKRKKRKLG